MRINDALGVMVSVFDDWGGALANPNYARIERTIAWNKFEPAILGESITRLDVAELATNRQYSFQVTEDGALIQLLYIFGRGGDRPIAANLAYYGVARQSRGGEEGSNEDRLEEELDPVGLEETVPWFRIDYQPEHVRGVLHGECHLHISGLPNARFLVNGVPTPRQFVELVMALRYPETYERVRLGTNGEYVDMNRIRQVNQVPIPCGPEHVFRLMAHIAVPRDAG